MARRLHPRLQRVEQGVVVGRIQVSREKDGGLLTGDPLHPGDHHPGRFGAGLLADMIEMGVEIEELLSGFPVLELHPHRDAAAHGVPAPRRAFGRGADPEKPAVEQTGGAPRNPAVVAVGAGLVIADVERHQFQVGLRSGGGQRLVVLRPQGQRKAEKRNKKQ